MIPYRGKVTLEKTIKYIEENTSYHWASVLKSFDATSLNFRLDEETSSKIIFKLVEKDIHPSELHFILKISESLNLSVANKENKGIFEEFVNLYLNNYEKFVNEEYFDKLISSFNDKKIALEYLRYIYSNKPIEDVETIKQFIDYIIIARQYYVDDRALLSSAIDLLNSIEESTLRFGHEEEIQKAIERKIVEAKKANGIYDIDQFTLEDFEKKYSDYELLFDRLTGLSEMIDQQIEILKAETKKSSDELSDIKIKTLKELKTESNKILTNFRKHYLELLTKEKENIQNHNDILIADLDSEFQKRKLELETLITNVGQRITIELGRIRSASDHSIESMQQFISNNEDVKRMFAVAKEDQAILSGLAKLGEMPTMGSASTPVVAPQSVLAVPSIVVPKPERIVDGKVNYYFDSKIPFKDRFNELMEKKQEDIEKNGSIYHEKFDDLLTLVLNNKAPYMYGPSGCGKTYMVEKQLAKLLGIDVITNGYIMYEQDVIGFNNANGQYVPSNFYRCYKFGDIIFFDEFDNSNPDSTVVLNSFMNGGMNSSYTFPDGINIKKHPNFKILTAGNTNGKGKTVLYNTRKKQDPSVMRRLTPIEIGYDTRIDKEILTDYPDWFNFIINYRKALNKIKIGECDGSEYYGTITTADIQSIKEYKDNNSFTDEKILQYEIIENKDADYLNQILTELEGLKHNGKFTDESVKILEKLKIVSNKVK